MQSIKQQLNNQPNLFKKEQIIIPSQKDAGFFIITALDEIMMNSSQILCQRLKSFMVNFIRGIHI
jgi:hypothetical protein